IQGDGRRTAPGGSFGARLSRVQGHAFERTGRPDRPSKRLVFPPGSWTNAQQKHGSISLWSAGDLRLRGRRPRRSSLLEMFWWKDKRAKNLDIAFRKIAASTLLRECPTSAAAGSNWSTLCGISTFV